MGDRYTGRNREGNLLSEKKRTSSGNHNKTKHKNVHNWHSRKSNQSITIRSANVVSFIRLSGLFITMHNSKREYLDCFRSFAWCLKKLVCIMKKNELVANERAMPMPMPMPVLYMCILHVRWIYDFFLWLF